MFGKNDIEELLRVLKKECGRSMGVQKKAGIVCCSNGQPSANREQIEALKNTLQRINITPVFSDFIYEKNSVASGTARERADALMQFYRDDSVEEIFDISGGDIANEILPYLDFSVIAESGKRFWGYSDLTTIINAIYAKTGKASVLYQVRNLIYGHAGRQIEDFCSTVCEGTERLFSFAYEWVQGQHMEGIVVGGNIRCLLKLAGTEYWPDMRDKILLLEAYGGTVPQMTAHLAQLSQLGVFGQVQGILLGAFTKMEAANESPSMTELVRRFAGGDIPIAKTRWIGHGTDAKGVVVGGRSPLKMGE